MAEAGIQTYFRAPVEAVMMAGLYRQDEWDFIDDRTRRLWPIFNEEYAFDAYVDTFAALAGKLGSFDEYYLHPVSYGAWRRGGGTSELPSNGRGAHLIPAHVLNDHDYARRVNPGGLADCKGTYSLPAKTGRYTTSAGRLTEAELNAKAAEFQSPLIDGPWRNFDTSTAKYQWQDPDVDAMYRYSQEHSRLLRDSGAALLRRDIDARRADAGESPWREMHPARDREAV
jgi:hypothetical protein